MGRAEPAADRWARKYVVREDGCWEWIAAMHPLGYGWFGPTIGVTTLAHRFGYELFVGPVPAGLELDHLCHTRDLECPGGKCRHRRCVNPAHLEPVTHAENIARGVVARATHCPNGHEYSDANTLVYRGHRTCRVCRRARENAARLDGRRA